MHRINIDFHLFWVSFSRAGIFSHSHQNLPTSLITTKYWSLVFWVWILCFQWIALWVLLCIQPSPCSAACVLAVLHTEAPTTQHEKYFLSSQWSSLCFRQTCITFASTVPNNKHATRSHVAIYCAEFFKRSEKIEGICVGCMSGVGLNGPLVAATLSFLLGSGHSSSILYPMSLCCRDKVFFVCPRLLARAHRALKLRLSDGIFISIPSFRAHSHPSLLSRRTEPHPLTPLTHPPTSPFSLSNNLSGTVLHWHQHRAGY